jgi:integrase
MGHARANRQKLSEIASKEMILRGHLIPALGHKRLDAITNEDVQRLKHGLQAKSPKRSTAAVVRVARGLEWRSQLDQRREDSHLAMRGAPAKAIQELAGDQDLSMTQRYMHLSPAALDAAIRLLDGRGRGDMLETAAVGSRELQSV